MAHRYNRRRGRHAMLRAHDASPAAEDAPTGGLTRRDVDALYKPLRDTHEFLSASRDPSPMKDVGHTALAAGEVAAGALGFGYLYGRTQHWNIPGTPIPIGLAAGVAGHLLNMFVLGKSRWSPHVANLSNGAIGSWTTMWGAALGTQGRQKAGLATAPITAGLMGCSSCAHATGAHPAPQLAAGLPTRHPALDHGALGARPMPMTEAELAAVSRHVR